MGFRFPNPKLVKLHRNYTVEEIALEFGVHKNTVRNWRRLGLKAIDDQRRPLLVLGSELSEFLSERRAKAKKKCHAGELYCVKCREPRRPAANVADYLPLDTKSGNLRGICPLCATLIHRRVNLADLQQVKGVLEIKFMQAESRIERTSSSSVNCDLGQRGLPHDKPQSSE